MLVVFRQIVPGQLLGHSDLVAHSKKTHPSASIGIALLKLNLRQKIIVKLSIDFLAPKVTTKSFSRWRGKVLSKTEFRLYLA